MNRRPGSHLLRFASPVLLALVAATIAGCDDDDDDDDLDIIADPQELVVVADYEWETRSDIIDWDTGASVGRMQLLIDDFHHGDFRIRVFDALGDEILDVAYLSDDDVFFVGDFELQDVRFTEEGAPGRWTIRLDYDDFTGEVRVEIEDNLNPP